MRQVNRDSGTSLLLDLARRCDRIIEVVDGRGDQVAIRWRFTFIFKDGGKLQQEEVAWQTWRGEKIATETFFYDPAQRG
jgi:ketosteroid isomerase-like protein